jgi:hypothetical protein
MGWVGKGSFANVAPKFAATFATLGFDLSTGCELFVTICLGVADKS